MRLFVMRCDVFVVMTCLVLATGVTGFTYQGQLMEQGIPLNSNVDLKMSLYDVQSAGISLGVLELSNVTVASGMFSVVLKQKKQKGQTRLKAA